MNMALQWKKEKLAEEIYKIALENIEDNINIKENNFYGRNL